MPNVRALDAGVAEGTVTRGVGVAPVDRLSYMAGNIRTTPCAIIKSAIPERLFGDIKRIGPTLVITAVS